PAARPGVSSWDAAGVPRASPGSAAAADDTHALRVSAVAARDVATPVRGPVGLQAVTGVPDRRVARQRTGVGPRPGGQRAAGEVDVGPGREAVAPEGVAPDHEA